MRRLEQQKEKDVMSVLYPMKHDDSRTIILNFMRQYQDNLTEELSCFDGKSTFKEDNWSYSNQGQGRTRSIREGGYFEQGSVNFSEIFSNKAPVSLLNQIPEIEGHELWGAGVSVILHPRNPYCPTAHLNYRYFEAGPIWWFAGGADLTPYYPCLEDCVHWHKTLKNTMDAHDPNYYSAFNYWCNEYYYNHHRNETRGIGGTFYDYLNGKEGLLIKNDHARRSEQGGHDALQLTQAAKSWDEIFHFHQDNANVFLKAYLPIGEKRRKTQWSDQQRQFQLYRRGRYVEFNLLYDRGTEFGLQSKGRMESILSSLPPLVRWQYDCTPEAGSVEESLTTRYLHRHIDWLSNNNTKSFKNDTTRK